MVPLIQGLLAGVLLLEGRFILEVQPPMWVLYPLRLGEY